MATGPSPLWRVPSTPSPNPPPAPQRQSRLPSLAACGPVLSPSHEIKRGQEGGQNNSFTDLTMLSTLDTRTVHKSTWYITHSLYDCVYLQYCTVLYYCARYTKVRVRMCSLVRSQSHKVDQTYEICAHTKVLVHPPSRLLPAARAPLLRTPLYWSPPGLGARLRDSSSCFSHGTMTSPFRDFSPTLPPPPGSGKRLFFLGMQVQAERDPSRAF